MLAHVAGWRCELENLYIAMMAGLLILIASMTSVEMGKAGHEAETIVTFAKEGRFDLLVIGFVGHSNIWGRIMGSTTQNISRLAPCSVVIVK